MEYRKKQTLKTELIVEKVGTATRDTLTMCT